MSTSTPASYNLTPRSRVVRADQVHTGHIVIESREHPAVVTRIGRPQSVNYRSWCRYVWQATHEPDWPMPDMKPSDPVRISKEK